MSYEHLDSASDGDMSQDIPTPPACFMCRFIHTQNARTLQTFITENIGQSTPEHIASEMSTSLQRLHPEVDELSRSQSMCLQHIKHHTLSPTIRMAMMLRSMLHISDQMYAKLDRLEEDVDVKVLESYTKLQSQIMNVYKIPDATRLLFADKTQ